MAAAWLRCPHCEDFWCTIHGAHVHECACPPIEEWRVDPYTSTPAAAVEDKGAAGHLFSLASLDALQQTTYDSLVRQTHSSKGKTMCDVLTHAWQEKGLGSAPFRVVCMISVPGPAVCEANPDAYNRLWSECSAQAARFGVQLCTCYACGMSLANNVVIRDAAGRHFVVGLDCAGKTGDHKLISQAEAMERARQREIRQAKAEAERIERQARETAERAAREAAERDRNGGLTDDELRQKQEAEAERAAYERYSAENAWLLDVLAQAYQGDFLRSICEQLRRKPLADLAGGRALDIVAEIYAKTKGGRKGSKAYKAALDEIYERLPAEEE